jgi:hypothetical protein
MAFSGDVRKAVVVLTPSFNTPANRLAMRSMLTERGFVVIADEQRKLHHESAVSLVEGSTSGKDARVAAELVRSLVGGESSLLVVARVDVFEQLTALLWENGLTGAKSEVLVSRPEGAAAQLGGVFPRLTRDDIPSNTEARDYAQTELKALLVKGLTELAKAKPQEPVKALADWLLANNPHRPPASA